MENNMESELDWGEYPITTSEAAFSIAPLTPVHTFTMQNGEGKQAHVDFGGEEVTYSGDLPFAESAKLFFDAVFAHWNEKPRCKTCDWYENGKELWRTCNCPKMIYGYGKTQVLHSDNLSVEDDEGWGMVPGPDFGCVHHKEKS